MPPFVLTLTGWLASRAAGLAGLRLPSARGMAIAGAWMALAALIVWGVVSLPSRWERIGGLKFEAKAHKVDADRLREEIRIRGHADQAATHARAQIVLAGRAQAETGDALEKALAQLAAAQIELATTRAELAGTAPKPAASRAPLYPPAVVKGIYE